MHGTNRIGYDRYVEIGLIPGVSATDRFRPEAGLRYPVYPTSSPHGFGHWFPPICGRLTR